MKLFILALIAVLNTGCASYCLSSVEGSYNDPKREFVDTSDSIKVNGYKIDSFTHDGVQGRLYSFQGCLKGEGRLLHVFIPSDTSDLSAGVFEDESLIFYEGDKVDGNLNFVPYFVAEEKKVHDPDDIIQINLSQLFICHGASSTFASIIEEGIEYRGYLNVEQKERSPFVGVLIKSGYIITVPVDIVITPPLLVIFGTIALFKSIW